MKKVLMIALDFPPCQSAGVQRTLHFKRYLEKRGWDPLVLTSKPFIYDKIDGAQVNQEEFFNNKVYRAFGLNAFKHLSIKGKHFGFTILPDKFSTWYWDASRVGKKVIERESPELIWTTFPCSTTVRIGLHLKRVSGLPWVADFRDPFSGTNPYVRAKNPIGKVIDERVARYADSLVFTTQNAANLYLKEYPFIDEAKISIIPNGFNEESFRTLKHSENQEVGDKNELTILHSGFLYPGGRDINSLIDAVVALKGDSPETFARLRFVFRGSNPNEDTLEKIQQHGLVKKVIFLPGIPFEDSLREMFNSEVLLVLQGEIFNNQIPGKVYEYLRAKRPILALTHDKGATAELLKEVPHAVLADMKDKGQIKQALLKLSGTSVDDGFDPSQYNRDHGAIELLDLFQKTLSQTAMNGLNCSEKAKG